MYPPSGSADKCSALPDIFYNRHTTLTHLYKVFLFYFRKWGKDIK